MKKTILHIATTLSLLVGTGISTSYSQDGGVFFNAGASLSTLKMEGLGSFFTTYNDYHKGSLSQGFNDNLGLLKGYSVMAGYKIGPLEAGLGIVQNFGSNRATYNNGDEQVVRFNQKDYLVDMLLGNQIIAWDLGIMMSSANIRVFYKNSNGVNDYHNQYSSSGKSWLNGYYKAWSLSFYTGIRLGIPLDDEGMFGLTLRGDYVFKPTGGVDFSDEEPSKQSTPSFTGGRPNLPSDVNEYFNGSHADNVYNTIANENSHFRLMLSLQINLIDY